MDRVQVRLLGPVDVVVNGDARPVSGLRRKAALAILALRHGEVVSTDRLIDVVWDERPPATATNTLQRHISHLRALLGPGATIEARSPGYVLTMDSSECDDVSDVAVAERLVRQGTQATDAGLASSRLRAALDLWRGQPLEDVATSSWLREQADRLSMLRLSAIHACNEARLELGEHSGLIPGLELLTREHAFHEQFHRQLMLALYRDGRQADALAVYQRLRGHLDGELGIVPSPALRELEVAILQQDKALELTPPALTVRPDSAVRTAEHILPRQLPLPVRGFTGRRAELAFLDEVLNRMGDGSVSETMLITGPAGVGKTTLATWSNLAARKRLCGIPSRGSDFTCWRVIGLARPVHSTVPAGCTSNSMTTNAPFLC